MYKRQSLYPKSSTSPFTGTTTELFFQNGNLPTDVKQLTNIPLVTTTPGATGYGFKSPWGLTFNFGFVLSPSISGTDSITFQVPFTGPIFFANVTPFAVPAIPSIDTISTTGMTFSGYINSGNVAGIYFIAIGI